MTAPGGLLIGVFFWKLPPDGPPWPTDEEDLTRHFSPAFEVERLEPNPVSVTNRIGHEGWAVFRRR